jgi:beta-galactosidase/beta-glucuronidase
MKRLPLLILLAAILLVACRTDQTTLWKSDRVYLNSEFGCVHNAWQFRCGGQWHSATVPGNIHDDLLANKLIPDPFYGDNESKVQWVSDSVWEYIVHFDRNCGHGKSFVHNELVFEGLDTYAEVYINGQKAGQHHYGYTPFTVDITKYLKKDKKQVNEVLVKVDNSQQPNCRWYSGSGIYRHVWLETMPALHIAEDGVFVTTPEVSNNKAKVQVEVTMQNESNNYQQGVVEVEGQQQQVSLKAGESKAITFTYTINNPKLWSPESPYLYETQAKLISHLSPLTSPLGPTGRFPQKKLSTNKRLRRSRRLSPVVHPCPESHILQHDLILYHWRHPRWQGEA